MTYEELVAWAEEIQPKLIELEADELWDEVNRIVEALTGKET
jgi:hypothetical protein